MKFGSGKRDDVELSLTPLIDVVFLLLIFFMVSTTFDRVAQLELRLPDAGSAQPTEQVEPTEIWVAGDGRVFVDGEELVNRSARILELHLRRMYGVEADERADERQVLLRADASAEHQWVVTIIDVLSDLGVRAVSIATRQGAPADAADENGDDN